jgi:hypothetical protein
MHEDLAWVESFSNTEAICAAANHIEIYGGT